jgi:hypothetical protein
MPSSPVKPREIAFLDDSQTKMFGQSARACALSPERNSQAFSAQICTPQAIPAPSGVESPQSMQVHSGFISPLQTHRSAKSSASTNSSSALSVSASEQFEALQLRVDPPFHPEQCYLEPDKQILSTNESCRPDTDGQEATQMIKISKSRGASCTPRAPVSPITSPRNQQAATQANNSMSASSTFISLAAGKSGLWNLAPQAAIATIPENRGEHLKPSQNGPTHRNTNWTQTQAALQAVMHSARDISTSASRELSSNQNALNHLKRRHGKINSAIFAALATTPAGGLRPNKFNKHHGEMEFRPATDISNSTMKALLAIRIRRWAFAVLKAKRIDHAWQRNKEQSRWFQLVHLRSDPHVSRRVDKYDKSVLILQKFGRAVPFYALRQFRRNLRRLRHRRASRIDFEDLKLLHKDIRITYQAQHSISNQVRTVVSAAQNLQIQSSEQYNERLSVWNIGLLTGMLAERLPYNWEVQREGSHETRVPKLRLLVEGQGVVDGVSYINVKTSQTRRSHPNMKQAKRIFRGEANRTQKLVAEARTTLIKFINSVEVARDALCMDTIDTMGSMWTAMQGNGVAASVGKQRSEGRDDKIAPDSHIASHAAASSGEKARKAPVCSTLATPSKPSFSLAELDEEHLYGQSQLAPQLNRLTQHQPATIHKSRPVEVVVENKTILSNMIADTKSRLSALLAKAMQ